MDLQGLRNAVAGAGVGIRSRTVLTPLGGDGDKVFPPTYMADGRIDTLYALETRRIKGADVPCVVLDSVASQANRRELALLDAARRGEAQIPITSVDFRPTAVRHLDRISSLEAPHRIFDALLRDSLLGGVLFRNSDIGRSITEATHRSATALFRWSPTTLLFGGWDSTGPKGGRGAKYERAITAEIAAIGVQTGVKTSSRIDPAGIENKAGPVYEAADGTWTLEANEALLDEKDNPVPVSGGAEGGSAGRPAQVNHGNIPPSIDRRAGGITADHIEMTTTLSFPALRRLRFTLDGAGQPFTDTARADAENAAHTALAALGIAATVLAVEDGFDLRSRCVLTPTGPFTFDLVRRDGTAEPMSLDRAGALDLLAGAVDTAVRTGLQWEVDELLLTPTDRLVELIRRSHEIAATGNDDDES